MSAPELTGERVRLRGWHANDLEPYVELLAEPEVSYWFGGVLKSELVRARFPAMAEALARRGWGNWAIEADGELVGAAGLQPVPADSGLAFAPAIEAAWRLKRAAWGKGYATEAMRLILDYAATVPELMQQPLVSFTATTNLRSQAVMTRLGFERDPAGDFDHPALAGDHPLRRHMLFRRGWRPLTAPSP
jgi:ribosomal-protein-alanine N-acetyltransferase